MTNSTDQYWDVNGTSLQTYAQNIVTLGGDRIAPPPIRGGNVIVPSQAGQLYMPKIVDARIISLGMWVAGSNPDGTKPTTESAAQLWYDNFRALRNLLMGGPYNLTKRFYVGGALKVATASAEFADGLNPAMNGPASGAFTVDLSLADPYFYTPVVNQTLSNGSNTVTVAGDAPTRKILVHWAGARVNPKIRNDTMGIDATFEGSLNTGDALDLDIYNYTAKTTPSGLAQFDSTGAMQHSGAYSWLELQPGNNTIIVSSTTGTGTATLSWQEAWI